MPLPLIIGGVAAVAGIAGVGTGIHGGIKMKDANDTMKAAQSKQEKAIKKFEANNLETTKIMDKLGKKELQILTSFDKFSNLIEKIQGRPDFKEIKKDGVDIPEYAAEELKKVSAAAGAVLGGIGGAAAGTAGGFAAAGATTSVVMALGTASTGTAISTLSGAAATNAALAALGGGATTVGGGGMALGSAVLGGATLGVGLLVGGVIFSVTGSSLSEKADEAWEQAKKTEKEVNSIVSYLEKLREIANDFYDALDSVDKQYVKNLNTLDHIINFSEKRCWNDFSDKEKLTTENTVLLVGLLYKMCQVKLVLKNENENQQNKINKIEADEMINNAYNIIDGQNDDIESVTPHGDADDESIFVLSLMNVGDDKVQTIRLIRQVSGVSLNKAKDIVSKLEWSKSVDFMEATKTKALNIKYKFQEIGCDIDMIDKDYL